MASILGFFNRPWIFAPFEQELDMIVETGAKDVGLLGNPAGGHFVEWNTSFDEIARIKDAITSRGLRMNALLAQAHFDVSTDESIGRYKAFIDRAAALGAPTLLEMGAHDPKTFDMYFDVMRAVSPYAQDKGMMVAVKPHGGLSSSGKECVQVVERVGHPNYRLWYDPGNILYYHQLDPVAEAREVQGIVVGMCVKDCVIGADGKPDVDVTPGEGQVDFEGVFRTLWDGGFHEGSCIIETLGPKEPQATTEAGKKALQYIGGIMRSIGYRLG